MAAIHGRNARVYLKRFDVSSYFNSASIAVAQETGDVTAFGDDWREYIGGLSTATLSFTGHHDPDLTELDTMLGSDGNVVTYCPGGATAIGDLARMATVITGTLATSSPVGDVVAISWDVVADSSIGAGVGAGWLLHPLGEDTNTTTGATRDDGAATATGWMAHLHVIGPVDGGSWVIKLQDSADGGSWADVTSGAFGAYTAVGSQRIASTTNTAALRRYVRYVATRTGGSAGDGITFVLAYARNV